MLASKGLRALALVAAVSACASGSGSTGLTDSNSPGIDGVWNAIRVHYTSTQDSTTTAELVSEGYVAKYTFNSDQSYRLVSMASGAAQQTEVGTFTMTPTTLTLVNTSEVPAEALSFTMDLGADTLTLSGAITFHKFGSADPVPARLDIRMSRQ